jgi:hypothetical protein
MIRSVLTLGRRAISYRQSELLADSIWLRSARGRARPFFPSIESNR